jgi:hypothetical protein
MNKYISEKYSNLVFKIFLIILFACIFFSIVFANHGQINFNEIVTFTDYSSQAYLNHIYKFNLVHGRDTFFQLGPLAIVRNFIFDPEIFYKYLFLRFIFLLLHFYLVYDYLKHFNLNKFIFLFLIYIYVLLVFLDQDGIHYILFFFLVIPIFSKINTTTKTILIFLIAFHSLIKLTFFVLALFSLFIFFLYKKKISEVFFIIFVYLFSLITLNFFSGFSIESLFNYLFLNLNFIGGYAEGHVLYHKPLETFFLILIIILNYFLTLILLKNYSLYSKFLSTIFYFGLSYMAYKHAIVRHDAHIWHSLVFYIFLSLLIFSMFFSSKNFLLEKRFSKIFILFFIFSIFLNSLIFKNYYETNYFKMFKVLSNEIFLKNLFDPKSTIINSTIVNYELRKKIYYDLKKKSKNNNDLQEKFDVFSDNPMLGFVFEENYLPRPSNYSFNTYGKKIITLNKEHYLKDELKFILLPNNFTQYVDNRFFFNMDNYIWPVLYENFKIENELIFNNHVFFKLKKEKKTDFSLSIINSKVFNFDDVINLDYCDNTIKYCFAKFYIEKTFFGNLIDFFYKPVPYVIEFSSNNKTFKYRFTFANAKDGFLIKPFFYEIADLKNKKDCRINSISCPKIDNFKITPYAEVKFLNYNLTRFYAKKFKIEEGILRFN